MKEFIIDLDYIPLSNHVDNVSYYKFNSLIPINSEYKLYLQPYYQNSPYIFRDFNTQFDDLLKNNKTFKKTSNKSYNMGLCYIPNKSHGNIINTEKIPVKTSTYNIIKKPYFIKEIVTFDKDIKHELYTNLYLNIGPLKNKKITKSVQFIAYNIDKSTYFTFIKWVPINNIIINNPNYYEIDISNFIDIDYMKSNIQNISSKKNIIILCSYI